jgi:DNA polymerase-3 subunit gamma/tau
MAAQALYLKYRPQTFEEVVGQEPITRTLRNALRQGRLRHAYLFTGPRGTGKTTTARLLAKAVNCLAPEEERPCNACAICVAINEGRLLDLIEIDAASNRGIDEIRELREKVGFRPNQARRKVYVLDEAHMLTGPAFNALLKTLEEPPPHVIFVLVTTEPHSIPATIISRCQRFDFRRVPIQAIVGRLAYIAGQEGLTVQPEALELIALQGTGAVRDAISLLDQLASYGDEIVLEQVQRVLGTVAGAAAGQVAACMARGELAGGLDLINRTVADGVDPRQFAREVVDYLRSLLLIHEGAGTRLLHTTAEQAAEMEALAAHLPLERLVRALRLFNEASTDLRRGFQTIPQLPLELALVESLAGERAAPVAPDAEAKPQSSATPAPADSGTAEGSSATRAPVRSGIVEGSSATPAPVRSGTVEGSRVTPVQSGSGNAEASTTTPVQSGLETAEAGAVTPAQEPTAKSRHQPQVRRVAEGSPPLEKPEPAAGPTLSLANLHGAWEEVLRAVRRLNPTTEGALRTGCEPVEVNGNEVVVTFPYPFLRDKLGDPARKMEIQEALGELLGLKCRLKLVLASEHRPSRPANPTPEVPQADGPEAAPSGVVESGTEAAEPELDDQDLHRLRRWAEGVGGQVVEE